MIREASTDEEIKPAEFVYRNGFMRMEHNYLCSVCRHESAVIDCSAGILQPCWECMRKGYYVRKKSWIEKLFGEKK